MIESETDRLLRLCGGLAAIYPLDNPIAGLLSDLVADISAGALRSEVQDNATQVLATLDDAQSTAHRLVTDALAYFGAKA